MLTWNHDRPTGRRGTFLHPFPWDSKIGSNGFTDVCLLRRCDQSDPDRPEPHVPGRGYGRKTEPLAMTRRKSEIGCQKSDVRNQMSEIRCQKSARSPQGYKTTDK